MMTLGNEEAQEKGSVYIYTMRVCVHKGRLCDAISLWESPIGPNKAECSFPEQTPHSAPPLGGAPSNSWRSVPGCCP